MYIVPGDGACAPNSAAAFFFQDEVFGLKLRKTMNQFFQSIGIENINIKLNALLSILLFGL